MGYWKILWVCVFAYVCIYSILWGKNCSSGLQFNWSVNKRCAKTSSYLLMNYAQPSVVRCSVVEQKITALRLMIGRLAFSPPDHHFHPLRMLYYLLSYHLVDIFIALCFFCSQISLLCLCLTLLPGMLVLFLPLSLFLSSSHPPWLYWHFLVFCFILSLAVFEIYTEPSLISEPARLDNWKACG